MSEKEERKGLLDLTIKEMKKLQINLGDLFTLKGATINLSWDQAIRTVNYLAKKEILTKLSTAGEALEAMGNFL